jgi:hypothetical protein
MFVNHLHTTLHMPSFNGSLVLAIKLQANENLCILSMFFLFIFYRIHTQTHTTKVSVFYKPYYHIPQQDSRLTVDSVIPKVKLSL